MNLQSIRASVQNAVAKVKNSKLLATGLATVLTALAGAQVQVKLTNPEQVQLNSSNYAIAGANNNDVRFIQGTGSVAFSSNGNRFQSNSEFYTYIAPDDTLASIRSSTGTDVTLTNLASGISTTQSGFGLLETVYVHTAPSKYTVVAGQDNGNIVSYDLANPSQRTNVAVGAHIVAANAGTGLFRIDGDTYGVITNGVNVRQFDVAANLFSVDPNGRYVVGTKNGQSYRLDLQNGQETFYTSVPGFTNAQTAAVAVDGDGKVLINADNGSSKTAFEAETPANTIFYTDLNDLLIKPTATSHIDAVGGLTYGQFAVYRSDNEAGIGLRQFTDHGQFIGQPVPEPSAFGAVAIGVLGLAARRRKASHINMRGSVADPANDHSRDDASRNAYGARSLHVGGRVSKSAAKKQANNSHTLG